MESPSVAPMDVSDINVCLLSAKRRVRTLSPTRSLRAPDQMSLCHFPSSMSVSEGLGRGGAMRSGLVAGGKGGKRKRNRKEFDTQSVDITFREPQVKKPRRPLHKVPSIQSLANIVRDTPLRHAKQSLKRSFSFSRDHPNSPATKYRLPPAFKENGTLHRRKLALSKPHLPANWVDCVGREEVDGRYQPEEVKRQEALYSIFKTETELVEDLKMIINIFFHPLLRLNLISEEDHCKIFGNIQTILSLHEDLVSKLQELRSSGHNGECIDSIGETLLQWSSTLSPYADYCANLVTAKRTLEATRQDPAVEDFLQRCLDSEFSRKIELWTFLDAPRTRIMKYPILLKEAKKKTPTGHQDVGFLDQAISSFDDVIKEIDHRTGIAKCLDIISRLEYVHDDQRCSAIDDSTQILCSGILRNKNGSKLHAFLLNQALVLTRPSSRSSSSLNYQVYRQPIPIQYLQVADICDGEAKISGSFRGALRTSGGGGNKHLLKVSCSDPTISCHAHTLQANGDFDKKAWMDAFSKVVQITRSTHVTTV